jgi:hypothetical protein
LPGQVGDRAEPGQVTDDCVLVPCSTLKVCALLESGLEDSRVAVHREHRQVRCNTHIYTSRVGRSAKDYVSILDVVVLSFIGMAGG